MGRLIFIPTGDAKKDIKQLTDINYYYSKMGKVLIVCFVGLLAVWLIGMLCLFI